MSEAETITLVSYGAGQLKKEERKMIRKILGLRKGCERWVRRSSDELYLLIKWSSDEERSNRNMRLISEEIRLERSRFVEHVISMDMDRRVGEIMERTRGETGTK